MALVHLPYPLIEKDAQFFSGQGSICLQEIGAKTVKLRRFKVPHYAGTLKL